MSRNTTGVKAAKSVSSAAARTALPGLVQTASSFKAPSRSLASRAVEIGAYNQGGAWLVPEIDAQAAIRREEALERRVQELEELLETVALAELVTERFAQDTGKRVSGIDFIRELGFEDIAAEVESSRSVSA